MKARDDEEEDEENDDDDDDGNEEMTVVVVSPHFRARRVFERGRSFRRHRSFDITIVRPPKGGGVGVVGDFG